ncbi:hypothetical protein [Aeromonas hydrophila]|uniref:hypothetical protein n=1 Tax=Aeromonas hydrophila TaxID=644 RepID=UPI002B485D2B|nr:hypothetical protein [Aeromonas hydrophila]
MITKLLIFFSFFLYVFDPWFFGVGRGVVIAGILVCGLLFVRHKEIYIDVKIMIMLIVFTVLSILPALYNGTSESGVFFMYIKMTLYFIISSLIACVIKDRDDFCKKLTHSVYVQTAVIIICLLSLPFVIEFVYSVHTADNKFYDSEQAYRLFFITSSAFFQFSLFWGVLFNLFMAIYNNNKSTKKLVAIFAIAFCGIMSGRSFMVFAAISVLFYGLKIKYIPYYAIALSVISYILFHFQDNVYVEHAMEPVLNFINNGELETTSSDSLMERHLFWPNDKQLLIGDGIYYNSDGSYYGHTDSGFVRQALYGGLFYAISCIFVFSYIVYKVSFKWFIGSQAWLFFISTSIITFLGNVKADVYMYPALLLNLFFLMLGVKKNEE